MSLKESPPAPVAAKSHVSRGVAHDEMLARVLHRDGLMLIIDKPAGLSVHRGPKGGPSLEDYLDGLRYGLPRRPELAHRLDKDTSGCLVLGRHRKALAHLGLLFKHRKIDKTYWAVVEGGPAADEGVIDLPLGRLDDRIGWWMKLRPGRSRKVFEIYALLFRSWARNRSAKCSSSPVLCLTKAKASRA